MRHLFENPPTPSEASPSVQIEDYLDHLCAPLMHKRTYEQRLAIREEVRSHLLVLATGHEELGSSPTEAIRAALNQFGDPHKIGHSLSQQYRRPFDLNRSLCWVLLHAAIGGVIGSIAWITMDSMLKQSQLVSNTAFSFDCLLGMASGWIPALHLLKRPTSLLKAGLSTGGFYLGLSTALMLLVCVLCGGKFYAGKDLHLILTVVTSVGIRGVIAGGVMSPLFRYLQRFEPRFKAQIAR